MEKSKRRNESVQQEHQGQPHVTEPPDVSAPAGLGVNLTANTLGKQNKGDYEMENLNNYNQIQNNCAIDAATVKDLLDHLGVHGLMSLVVSRKFAPYFSCVLREIDKAITEVDTPVAPNAVDGTGESRDAAAPAAKGLALPPSDDKVSAEIQQGAGVDVTGGGGPARLHRR